MGVYVVVLHHYLDLLVINYALADDRWLSAGSVGACGLSAGAVRERLRAVRELGFADRLGNA